VTKAQLLISGRVQGVFYRHSTKQIAESLGLSGWVRNLNNGMVEVEAVGPKIGVEHLIDWCRTGPSGAQVESLEVAWLNLDDCQAELSAGQEPPKFEIR
jgi:acylphosphatase